ncbi:hypothetical protein [Streptomyces sp. TLI_171]|uniref:hypothetical protein n=1 Tax=Streptomyces sp. TLI_171 TaxID=1938859 RepID=UPI000C483D79|nr:hypothetical protein [Streptomyces sp. TLI_171]RKE23502.1 hypothetical protein BX266_6974 [Streptomyces sp. TLI_171]
MAWILLLIIVAIVLGLLGAVVHGLGYLLAIGIVVFLVALTTGAIRARSARRKPTR